MFGLESKDKGKGLLEFDLEKDLKSDPSKAKKVLEEVEMTIQQLKTHLREGSSKEDLDHLGVLLHGYTALQKVINKLK